MTRALAAALSVLVAACASSPASTRFTSDRVHLICGNDDGAPNELTGCSIGLDGSFSVFDNEVRPLTIPVLSPGRELIAYAEPGGAVVLRGPDGRARQSFSLEGLSGPHDWSSDGSELLVSDRSALVVVDLGATGDSEKPQVSRIELPNDSDVLGVGQFSPDGTKLAIGVKREEGAAEFYGIAVVDREDGSIAVVGEQRAERDPTRFTGTFSDPAFSSDGRRLAWADGLSGELSVLNLDDQTTTSLELGQPPELITGVSWSPSGLIAVGVDATLRLVDPERRVFTEPLPAGWTITAAAPAWSSSGTEMITAVQVPETDALLDLARIDLESESVDLLTDSATPPPPISTFPGFPVWP